MTDVNISGVSAADFDSAARLAFIAVNREGLGDLYKDSVILSIFDVATHLALVSFSSEYVSDSILSEDDVQGILTSYELRMVDYYSEKSTVDLWVSECAARGSNNIDLSTAATFGHPSLDHSSVRVEAAVSTMSPSAVTAVVAGSDEVEITVLVITLCAVCCTLCIGSYILRRIKRRKLQLSGAVELSVTPNLLAMSAAAEQGCQHTHHDEKSWENEGLPTYCEEEEFEDSEEAQPKKPSKFNTAVKSSSLLRKVRSGKDRVMRKQRHQNYSKI